MLPERDSNLDGGTLRSRRGYLILEVATATLLLATMMFVVAGAVRLRLVTQRHAQQRQLALEAANNVLERMTAKGSSPASTDAVGAIDAAEPGTVVQLSDSVRAALPDAQLRVAVEDAEFGLNRVSVEIEWQLPSGQRSRAVRLVGWRPAQTIAVESAP
ncbi:MAG: hypothetical protein K2Y37_07415 [Pirellulales bacterium]|nr:hypothetical protein [Pirellulales bacterium]